VNIAARRACWILVVVLALGFTVAAPRAGAAGSLDFVAAHLPEVAMDIRYAALPVWPGMSVDGGVAWRPTVADGC
jgi:hypothetical protein